MKYFLLPVILFGLTSLGLAQNTLSATYASDIPTSFSSNLATYDNSCNGPSTVLIMTLPPGDNYTVTNVDVTYNMTAQGAGQKAHQRSKIKLENTGISETEVAGTGATTGTQTYNRTISIANGVYPGGTQLIFQMLAKRTVDGTPTGCGSSVNRVDANSWTITVHYSNEVINPKIGLNTATPAQTVDIAGKLKLGDDNTAPQAGTVRWNATTQDFEGYNGQEWLSFTDRKDEEWRSGNISEKVSATASDGAATDYFGFSCAISGDYAIIGAYSKTVGANPDQGKAYIFKRSGTSWTQQDDLVASDGAAYDNFGYSCAVSGDYAIIGAVNKNVGANSDQGKAYIFKRSGTTWTQEDDLVASDGAASDNFGYSVSISGDYAIISAFDKTVGANSDQGKAYIFKRSGTSWTQQADLVASDGAAGDFFGYSVSISGDYAIIGAFFKDVSVNLDLGKAYIFKRSGTTWTQQADLVASDGATGDFFGRSVSISGDYAIIGANGKNVGATPNQGKAYIFKRAGTTWTQQADLVASDGAAYDQFGYSVSVSGDYAIIGSVTKDVGFNADQGKAYIFRRSGTTWTQQAELVGSGGDSSDEFGYFVSISGSQIIVGAPNKDVGSNTYEGQVYFYSKE